VSCTAGTTVTGSFDPLQQIVDVCRKHGLWVHADGAWGGAVIFSDAHRWPPSDIATAYWYKGT
jgi:glutamate/tyrosine decarboxylase-like PLP-dependent enzyme